MQQKVTACIPYHKCQRFIRRAVESLLRQTHHELRIIVINDADFETPPWPALADITDERLVRYDLSATRGPYFATEVALLSTSDPFFLIQDADDWSHPERVERLLSALVKDGSDYATSAQPQYCHREDGCLQVVDIRWEEESDETAPAKKFVINRRIGERFAYRLPHHGLYQTKSLRRIGGYYGGFRIAYDTLLTNLILMTGKASHTPDPLYNRFIRWESLTHSPATGHTSLYASRVARQIEGIYNDCYRIYRDFIAGRLSSDQLTASLQQETQRWVTLEERACLGKEAEQLKHLICNPWS